MGVILQSVLYMTVCLLLTIVAEGILIYIITREKKFIRYSVICNIITNPAVNLILLLFSFYISDSRMSYYILLAALETAAVISEGVFYRMLSMMGYGRALLLSLVLNAFSFTAGFLLLW